MAALRGAKYGNPVGAAVLRPPELLVGENRIAAETSQQERRFGPRVQDIQYQQCQSSPKPLNG